MESHWVLAACCCLERVENNGLVQGFLFVQVVAMAAFSAAKSGSAKEQRTLLVVLCYQIICRHTLMLLVDMDGCMLRNDHPRRR